MSTEPKRYRKKQIEVHAIKWTQTTECWGAVQDLILPGPGDCGLRNTDGNPRADLYVETIDGNVVRVPGGAYVVLDAEGWPYPCSAAVFEATHEPVSS